ncbi:RNA polymerase sigma-70 factor [Saccharicrinis aurantiacus]|uniref:RNA polymerase sigma-70 factor n=1 Tax=Saccharicrinis aurantiacus TaxID=1849719 RepID=UPI0024927897|nr:RNA polymerase sigma-70 factor [Saccharicrinis aurantiacus]
MKEFTLKCESVLESDITLIKKLEKGDREAYESIFNYYYPTLIRFAEGYVFNRAISEDIVQDFFVWLWENRKQLKVRTNLRSYFYQAIKNRSLDYLKHLQVTDKYRVLFIQATMNAQLEEEEPENEVLFNKLSLIINQMPPQMAEIVKAKYFSSKKIEEIASQLDISVNTVKTQLSRGRKKIKEFISTILLLFT